MKVLRVIICFLAGLVMTSASNYSAQCKILDNENVIHVKLGEALRYCCDHNCDIMMKNSVVFWFKITFETIQPITTEENERVHYHENVLYFLPLHLNDTGHYIAQWWNSVSECSEIQTQILVHEKFHTNQLYGTFTEQISIVFLECPVCEARTLQNKTIAWYKNFHLMPEKSDAKLKVYLHSEGDNGIYTCMCTWEHHGQMYNSSGSFLLQRNDNPMQPVHPTFQYPLNNTVLTVDLGMDVTLNCLVFFGINIFEKWGSVYWERNNRRLKSSQRMENGMKLSTFTITQVSETDLQHNYCCIAVTPNEWTSVCITLKAKESLLPIVVTFLCTFLFLLLAAGMVKWFTVDLVLFFRSFQIMQCRKDDGKVFDAYVIYQKDNIDEITGRKVAHFVNKILPAVLEDSCGFKLYIHGRDDLPGEDCTELIETRMQLSRRLIAVLPPGDCQQQGTTTSLCYDWHVGLHQVLVEQELRVILIQLGEMQEYSHLPLGLQHLLQKTPPLRWDEGSDQATCPTSRFWKQVRYMMPVTPDSSSRHFDF